MKFLKKKSQYLPFYTFDADTQSHYTAERGDYYYVQKTVRNSNGSTSVVSERKIRWTHVSGNLDKHFEDLLIRGTDNALNSYVDKINDYDFTIMERYQEEFLLGFYAERPAVDLGNGFDHAKTVMKQDISSRCRSKIGGDEVKNLSVKTNFENVTFKLIMAPIYCGNYQFGKKHFRFIANGQTGKFVGDSPKSAVKIGILVFLLVLVVLGLLYLLFFTRS